MKTGDKNSYNLLHFDEKWIDGQYIKKFNSIQPNINDLIIFLKKIISKTNLNSKLYFQVI